MAYRKGRDPRLAKLPPGTWSAEVAADTPRYPQTPEAYAKVRERLLANRQRARARGLLTSPGVLKGHGGAGAKRRRQATRAAAYEAAKRTFPAILRSIPGHNGGPPLDDDPYADWDSRAVLAMTELIAIALDDSVSPRDRIRAAAVVLEWLQPKPVRKQLMAGGDTALDWLSRLVQGSQDAD